MAYTHTHPRYKTLKTKFKQHQPKEKLVRSTKKEKVSAKVNAKKVPRKESTLNVSFKKDIK